MMELEISNLQEETSGVVSEVTKAKFVREIRPN
jgi:hypothetical protein